MKASCDRVATADGACLIERSGREGQAARVHVGQDGSKARGRHVRQEQPRLALPAHGRPQVGAVRGQDGAMGTEEASAREHPRVVILAVLEQWAERRWWARGRSRGGGRSRPSAVARILTHHALMDKSCHHFSEISLRGFTGGSRHCAPREEFSNTLHSLARPSFELAFPDADEKKRFRFSAEDRAGAEGGGG